MTAQVGVDRRGGTPPGRPGEGMTTNDEAGIAAGSDRRGGSSWAWALAALALASGALIATTVAPAFARFSRYSGFAYSIWSDADVPEQASVNVGEPAEVGVRFAVREHGSVFGIRFYKGEENPGPHVASLWTADGEILASATHEADTASGWQSVWFPEPVPIDAATLYVVSYFAPRGGYAVTPDMLSGNETQSIGGGLFRVPPQRKTAANGMLREGGSGFPDGSGDGRNYWVDVLWAPEVAFE